MSKPVRLRDYLYAELEKIAARENRSLTNLVNHLLEQVLEMPAFTGGVRPEGGDRLGGVDEGSGTGGTKPSVPAPPVSADSQSRDVAARTIVPPDPDVGFKPDFKPEKGKKK